VLVLLWLPVIVSPCCKYHVMKCLVVFLHQTAVELSLIEINRLQYIGYIKSVN